MHPEKAFFEAFVTPNKRHRFSGLLDAKRGRDKIRLGLDHFKDLDPRFCRKLTNAEQNPGDIVRILRGLGAPAVCYVMSSDDLLDGREMNLSDVLKQIVGRGQGTIVSCVPGVLAYFESEDRGERYVCHREL